ncbi:hypothetical protein FB446DRAFT_727879 [Lentinula raphanica]|nr:hypothetical protein FB446DRAFT_727879 [Lentinula raphanica]
MGTCRFSSRPTTSPSPQFRVLPVFRNPNLDQIESFGLDLEGYTSPFSFFSSRHFSSKQPFMGVSVVQGQFISLFCETCFYGMYSVLFMALLVNYRQRPTFSRAVKSIRAVTIFQYAMVTVHISLAFFQNYLAFTVYDNAEAEFNKLGSAPYTLAQLAIEWTNCACADSILIWRVWMLWNQRFYVVILPIILVIISTTSGYLVLWSMHSVDSSASSDFGDLFGPAVERWAILLAVCIILTNIICTGMIAGRIWWHNREMQKALGVEDMPHKYRKIFYGILESGALYLLAWIVAVLLYLINTSAIIPMLDIISQLSGIVPALIVIIVSRSLDAATHHEEALTTMNYRRSSRMQIGTDYTVDRELPRSSPTISHEMLPVHLTNSYEPGSPASEKRMTFAENASLEKMKRPTTRTTQTTVSEASSKTIGTSGSEVVEVVV